MEQNNNILERLNNHEERLNKGEQRMDKHDEDINTLKTDNKVQMYKVNNLQISIDNLTNSMNKLSDKLENFFIDDSKTNMNKSNDNWKWIVSVILIPVIFLLLRYIFKC